MRAVVGRFALDSLGFTHLKRTPSCDFGERTDGESNLVARRSSPPRRQLFVMREQFEFVPQTPLVESCLQSHQIVTGSVHVVGHLHRCRQEEDKCNQLGTAYNVADRLFQWADIDEYKPNKSAMVSEAYDVSTDLHRK